MERIEMLFDVFICGIGYLDKLADRRESNNQNKLKTNKPVPLFCKI